MDTEEAISIAFERGYDLVLVAMKAKPPVCKIMDYGKYRFNEKKKFKEALQKQTTIKVKELRMRPRIDQHDYQVKLSKARGFLEFGMDAKTIRSPHTNKKNKVKFIVRLVGREMSHDELGYKVLKEFIEDLKDIGEIEQKPIRQGRTITMVIAPKKYGG